MTSVWESVCLPPQQQGSPRNTANPILVPASLNLPESPLPLPSLSTLQAAETCPFRATGTPPHLLGPSGFSLPSSPRSTAFFFQKKIFSTPLPIRGCHPTLSTEVWKSKSPRPLAPLCTVLSAQCPGGMSYWGSCSGTQPRL